MLNEYTDPCFAGVAQAADDEAERVLEVDRLSREAEARELLGPDPC